MTVADAIALIERAGGVVKSVATGRSGVDPTINFYVRGCHSSINAVDVLTANEVREAVEDAIATGERMSK